MILDRDLTGARLAAALAPLLEDAVARGAMASHARTLGRPDAAARVAEVCCAVRAARST
jgi:UDP-N-acetylglucosamine:LPS N-acetylglucosamine transferase